MQGPSPKVYWISSMACAAGLLLATVAAFFSRRSVMPHRISSPGSDRLRADTRASSQRKSSTSELLSTSSWSCSVY